MKNPTKICAFILMGFIILSCSPSKSLISSNTIQSDFVQVDLSLNLYCAKYEVTNKEYRIFLAYLKSHNLEAFQKCQIDSSQWTNLDPGNTAFKRNYAWHPAFDNYPVVNVPFYGAVQYCTWLNELYPKTDLVFRLPNEAEFKQIMNGAAITMHSDNASDYNCPNFNVNFVDNAALDGAQYTAPAKDFRKDLKDAFVQDKNGILHIVGNVAEYLSNGSSAGGSWNSYPSEIKKINANLEADPTVGFRVWFEKVE